MPKYDISGEVSVYIAIQGGTINAKNDEVAEEEIRDILEEIAQDLEIRYKGERKKISIQDISVQDAYPDISPA